MDVIVFGLLVFTSTICCGQSSCPYQKTAIPEVVLHKQVNSGGRVARSTKSGDELGKDAYETADQETDESTETGWQTYVDCDACVRKKGCHYCHKKCGCDKCNKKKCSKCLSESRCYHCYKHYGCETCTTVVDDNFCSDCVSDRGCGWCNKRFQCRCEMSCKKCLKHNTCLYCQENFGCDCSVYCDECLRTRLCSFCVKEFGCGAECGQAYGNRTSPTGDLPTCRKCFVPFVSLPPRLEVDQATANMLCSRSGYKLASARSAAEHQQLLATINEQQQHVGIWLAASCEPNCSKGNKTVWYWLDSPPSLGKTDLVSNYWDNWSPDEPDGNAGMMISKNFGYSWMGFKPRDTLPGYVCEKPCNYNCQGGPIELQMDSYTVMEMDLQRRKKARMK